MKQTGPVVTLQVAKFGASDHGLEALLAEPTPGGNTRELQPWFWFFSTSALYDLI